MRANRLREIREAKGLTPRQLAEAAGVQVVQIYQWQSGKPFPGERSRARLAHVLGVTVDELFPQMEAASA